jgi:uncharacterized protein (DUF488 family)
MLQPFFTVGHSNRTIDDFVDLLRAARIGMVIDVRRLPGSRTYPQSTARTWTSRWRRRR